MYWRARATFVPVQLTGSLSVSEDSEEVSYCTYHNSIRVTLVALAFLVVISSYNICSLHYAHVQYFASWLSVCKCKIEKALFQTYLLLV